MNVISTAKATDLCRKEMQPPFFVKVIRALVPSANPDFEQMYPSVRRWWIEIDSKGVPQREIGFDEMGSAIVAAPVGENFGFWTDSPMTFVAQDYEPVVQEQFEYEWNCFLSVHAGSPQQDRL